jgi:pimeloyl-ACP methyl ester carboxylesterase
MRNTISIAVSAMLFFSGAWLGNPPAACGQQRQADSLLTPQTKKTLGGQFIWGDELLYYKWRIQRNVITGHCRLLDGEERRHARGSFETCLARLEEIKRERNLPSMKGKVVLILQGLGDARISSVPMADYLEEEGGYLALCVGYPSLFDEIGQHAKSLASVVKHLDGVEEIDFVAHSMGNLVVRYYLGDQTDAAKGLAPDRRIKRFVMIAPPNNGSELAAQYADHPAFVMAFGVAGQELGARWKELAPKLAIPTCEFGIIAGGKGDDSGLLPKFEGNDLFPKLQGDNDGVLTVASTRLPGAADFIVVRNLHFMMMKSPKVMRYTLRFLKDGYFVAADKRKPIPKDK